MVDPINRKLSSRPVLKEDMEDFVNRELVPVIEKIRLTLATLLGLLMSGAGSPEGVVTASPAAIYQRTDGVPGTQIYVKQTGTGNTGWVAVL